MADNDDASNDLEFDLRGSDGKLHRWKVHPHPGKEGLRVVSTLVGLAAGPLAATAGALLAAGDFGSLRDALDADLAGVLEGVDLGAIGSELRAGVDAIPLDKLYPAILRYTSRDKEELADPAVFDRVFARNFGELHFGVFKVATINGFFQLPAISAKPKPKAKDNAKQSSDPSPAPPEGTASTG